MSLDEQLKKIFPEQLVVKRVKKELEQINEHHDFRKHYQVRYFYVKAEILVIKLTIKESYLVKISQEHKPRSDLECKIVYTKNYPYQRPKFYIMSNFLNENYTLACRDYLKDLCSNWSIKNQLIDLIKLIPGFYQKITQCHPINSLGGYARGDLIQNILNQKSIQTYPITIQITDKSENAYLVISRMDFIFLQKTDHENYTKIIDAFPIYCIRSLYVGNNDPKQVLIYIKWSSTQGGFQFKNDHPDHIIKSIIEKKKIYQKQYQEEAQLYDQKNNPVKQLIYAEPTVATSPASYLNQLNQSIMVVQSLLQKQYSDVQIGNLISLYKKAVQFCSARNVSDHKFYLQKLQQVLTRQETQALINSSTETKISKPINYSIFDSL